MPQCLNQPIAYDFNPCFDVAAIETLSSEQLAEYKQHKLPDFQMLIGGALARLESVEGLVDWFDYCARLSEKVQATTAARTSA